MEGWRLNPSVSEAGLTPALAGVATLAVARVGSATVPGAELGHSFPWTRARVFVNPTAYIPRRGGGGGDGGEGRGGAGGTDPSVFAIPLHSVALSHVDNNAKCKHVYVRVRYENALALFSRRDRPLYVRDSRRFLASIFENHFFQSPYLVNKAPISKVSILSPPFSRNDQNRSLSCATSYSRRFSSARSRSVVRSRIPRQNVIKFLDARHTSPRVELYRYWIFDERTSGNMGLNYLADYVYTGRFPNGGTSAWHLMRWLHYPVPEW